MNPAVKNQNEEKSVFFVLRALRFKNYRLFFVGQIVSLVGTWMQSIALVWLVYRLTHSTILLGVVGFMGQIPAFVLAPLAGVVADKRNRRQILLITQTLAMLQSFILTWLTFTGHISSVGIIWLAIFLGVVIAFDLPTRQAFVVEMVSKDYLMNAIALNSLMFNSARIIGPVLASILIALKGEAFCFLLNGVSYLAAIWSLLLIRVPGRVKKGSSGSFWQELHEGFRYVYQSPLIKSVLVLLGLVSLMSMPYMVLMPVFAEEIFRRGSHGLALLMTASGVGALIGAVYLASRKSAIGLERIIIIASGMLGFVLVGFAFSRIFVLSLFLLAIIGCAMILQMASSNVLLQTLLDDDKRGRVMSFHIMVFMGTAPFGSLLAGSLASKIGTPATVAIGGIACVVGAFLFRQKIPD